MIHERERFWPEGWLMSQTPVHVAINVAAPILPMLAISYLANLPQLRSFALQSVAPWAAVGAVIVCLAWRVLGARRHTMPAAMAAVLFMALTSAMTALIAASIGIPLGAPGMAIDGAIGGAFSGFMSSLVIHRQLKRRTGESD